MNIKEQIKEIKKNRLSDGEDIICELFNKFKTKELGKITFFTISSDKIIMEYNNETNKLYVSYKLYEYIYLVSDITNEKFVTLLNKYLIKININSKFEFFYSNRRINTIHEGKLIDDVLNNL